MQFQINPPVVLRYETYQPIKIVYEVSSFPDEEMIVLNYFRTASHIAKTTIQKLQEKYPALFSPNK